MRATSLPRSGARRPVAPPRCRRQAQTRSQAPRSVPGASRTSMRVSTPRAPNSSAQAPISISASGGRRRRPAATVASRSCSRFAPQRGAVPRLCGGLRNTGRRHQRERSAPVAAAASGRRHLSTTAIAPTTGSTPAAVVQRHILSVPFRAATRDAGSAATRATRLSSTDPVPAQFQIGRPLTERTVAGELARPTIDYLNGKARAKPQHTAITRGGVRMVGRTLQEKFAARNHRHCGPTQHSPAALAMITTRKQQLMKKQRTSHDDLRRRGRRPGCRLPRPVDPLNSPGLPEPGATDHIEVTSLSGRRSAVAPSSIYVITAMRSGPPRSRCPALRRPQPAGGGAHSGPYPSARAVHNASATSGCADRRPDLIRRCSRACSGTPRPDVEDVGRIE